MLPVSHRATGIILALGLLLFIFSLKFFAYHASFHPTHTVVYLLDACLTRITTGIRVSSMLSSFHHSPNGIRHPIRDFSPGNEKSLTITSLRRSANFVLFFTLLGGIVILA